MQIVFCFKLFICPSDIKRPKFFRSFIQRTPIRAPPCLSCSNYSTLRPSLAFYKIPKLNLCSKTDISKTAWINAWLWTKVSDQSPNFETFKCSGKSLPNFSCHFPNHKSLFVFFSNFASIFSVMKDSSSVLCSEGAH